MKILETFAWYSNVNLFEDLVEDLKKENLLDDSVSAYSNLGNNVFVYRNSKVEQTSNLALTDFSVIYEKPSLKISNLKESIAANLETPAADFLIESPAAYKIEDQTQNKANQLMQDGIETNKRRKIQIKSKKKGRYCKTCLIGVPRYRISCKFCGEKVSGSYFYYLLILFPILLLLFTILVFFITKKL